MQRNPLVAAFLALAASATQHFIRPASLTGRARIRGKVGEAGNKLARKAARGQLGLRHITSMTVVHNDKAIPNARCAR